jgi:hypothetical protein
MFLEQVVQNAITWLGTLQELSNLRVGFEQVKENLSETHNCMQTCSLDLEIMQKTLKNHDKKLVTSKGQLKKVQHQNLKLSNKLNEVEHVVRKTENL